MLFPHILEYFSISREEIDLLKNEVINDAVQTWINNMRILRKSLNLFVCVCTGFLVCVERERERGLKAVTMKLRIKICDEGKTFVPNCYVNKSSVCCGMNS